jgi:hypothetical protein
VVAKGRWVVPVGIGGDRLRVGDVLVELASGRHRIIEVRLARNVRWGRGPAPSRQQHDQDSDGNEEYRAQTDDDIPAQGGTSSRAALRFMPLDFALLAPVFVAAYRHGTALVSHPAPATEDHEQSHGDGAAGEANEHHQRLDVPAPNRGFTSTLHISRRESGCRASHDAHAPLTTRCWQYAYSAS